ncbi:MAG: PDZ domain-containing protein [Bernardetiaceae bacterium]|jgi:predicted metalloprotease with PDZ domain|nr:PDZ domain-containing protein [Bernardetiaceae bacterium]
MQKPLTLFFTLALLGLATLGQAQTLSYTLGMSRPHTHYFEVETRLTDLPAALLKRGYVDFKMPVWAPGSYLVREFAKNVEGETAQDLAGNPLAVQKVSKNTWRVQLGKANGLVFKYLVYAFEISVRTSYLDAMHGFVSPSGIFTFVDGQLGLPATVKIVPATGWTEIATSLEMVNGDKWTRQSPHYDLLADSPIEIGTHRTFEFTAAGIPHRFAMHGVVTYDAERIKRDVAKIVEEQVKVFGEHPCKDYTFIVHHYTNGSGGLEHLNSTVLGVNRLAYGTYGNYLGFLSLVSHEYFHLWNVKRLRPAPLGPFDYDNENYTRLLWVAEGFTDYYDGFFLRRAGLVSEDYYLNQIVDKISDHENAPGSAVQAVTESSFDAWIKAYRPNENSRNNTISYYGSGGRVAAMLDLEIIHRSKAQKSLDDVMKLLYDTYFKKLNRGFTEAEFQAAVETVAGQKMDEFFKNHVYGTAKIDYDKYLAYAGLRLEVKPDQAVTLGAGLADEGGKVMVRSLRRGAAAYEAGLSVNDEILAINNFRVTSAGNVNNTVLGKKVGEKITLTISRDGVLQNLDITLALAGTAEYQLVHEQGTPAQQRVYEKWVNGK